MKRLSVICGFLLLGCAFALAPRDFFGSLLCTVMGISALSFPILPRMKG